MEPTLVALLGILTRMERKLDLLIEALGEELEEVGEALDGTPLGNERDQSQSLG